MREMLEPVFGESGAVVAQFIVILVFVLILIGACYWLYRRYYGTGIGGGGRTRVPRLGIIDSLSIDPRHRLVLVRRDNVEHLLLIGKTADLVVEPSIVRNVPAGARPRPGQPARPQPQQRSPASHPQASAQPPAAPVPAPNRAHAPAPPDPPARPETSGISEPIPFPQARRPQTRAAPQAGAEPISESAHRAAHPGGATRQGRSGVRAEAPAKAPVSVAAVGGASIASASAHFEEPTRPTRVEPAFSLADAIDEIADEPIAARDAAAEARSPEPAPPEPPETAPAQQSEEERATSETEQPAETAEVPHDAPAANATEDDENEAANGRGEDEDRSAAVSNLEQEMARLLGEITAKRDS